MTRLDKIAALVAEEAETSDRESRVAAYNAIVALAARLVEDVASDPALAPKLVPMSQVRGNDYNPNHVAAPEMNLLERSIRADGVTMAVVVVEDPEEDSWTVVDGFHRTSVLRDRLGREYVPCSVIRAPQGDRMAATVRHNRARGKHGVELMASLVREMEELGWGEDKIARELGMSVEELLRLRQLVGAAPMLAAAEHSQSWGLIGSGS